MKVVAGALTLAVLIDCGSLQSSRDPCTHSCLDDPAFCEDIL